MRSWRWLLIFSVLVMSASLSMAGETRTVIYDGKPFTVTLAYGQPTIVVFPTSITRVPTGITEVELSVSIHERTLILHPRVKVLSGRLIVETAAGRHYQVDLHLATAHAGRQNGQPTPPDGEVLVTLPVQAPVSPFASAPAEPMTGKRPVPPSRHRVRAILISMWTASQYSPVRGVTVHPAERVLTHDDTHQVKIIRVYQAPPYYGYTLELENRQDRPWPLLLPQIEDDGLLVVAAEPVASPDQPLSSAEVIPPGGRGFLHLIYQGR